MTEFPILFTDRLILRKISVEDIPSLVKHVNNRRVAHFMLNIPFPYYEANAVFRISYVHQGFKSKSRYVFAIVLKESEEFIGEISLHTEGLKNSAQLAYWIGEEFWNRGIITEAISKVRDFAFDRLNLESVFATCEIENIGSVRVLEKNGFEQTGAAGNVLHFKSEASSV